MRITPGVSFHLLPPSIFYFEQNIFKTCHFQLNMQMLKIFNSFPSNKVSHFLHQKIPIFLCHLFCNSLYRHTYFKVTRAHIRNLLKKKNIPLTSHIYPPTLNSMKLGTINEIRFCCKSIITFIAQCDIPSFV
jgi:hypothetical protein